MPINSTININGSVGRRGRNNPMDVRAVQTRLNDLTRPPRTFLKVDGKSGPMTESVIADFQRSVCGSLNPDGRVDPGQKTLAALNDPASENKWLGMSMPSPATGPKAPTPVGVVYPVGLSARGKEAVDVMAKSTKSAEELGILNDFLKSTPITTLKKALEVQGSLDGLSKFGDGVRELRKAGVPARDIVSYLNNATEMQKGAGFTRFVTGISKNPRVLVAIKHLGTAATVLGIFLCAIEVVDHISAGNYGAAAGEIYGVGMGMAVPWAAFLSGIQSAAFAYAPGLRGRPTVTYFFQLLNAMDPINLGKIAVDSYVTLIHSVITSLHRGQLDTQQLERLVGRMNKTPARVLVEVGEWWGDTIFDGVQFTKGAFDGLLDRLRS